MFGVVIENISSGFVHTQCEPLQKTSKECYHHAMAILDRFNRESDVEEEEDLSEVWLREAIGYLNQAIDADPSYPGCHIIRGKIHLANHELDEAMIELSKAIELNLTFSDEYFIVGESLYLRSLAYYNSMKFKESWKDLTAAAGFGHEKARQDLQKYFTEEDRNLFDDAFSLAIGSSMEIIFFDNAEQYYNEAIHLYFLSEESVCKDGESWGKSAIIMQNRKALAYIEKAIELEPNYPGYYILKGKLHSCLYETDAAIDVFSKAIELNPGFSDSNFPCGEALFQKGLAYFGDFNSKKARENFASAASEFQHTAAELYLELMKKG